MELKVCCELELMAAGHCEQFERVVRKGGRWTMIPFPGAFALLKHPEHGIILFDTGYSAHNFAEMKPLPYRIYQWITPITLPPGQSAKEQLLARGIQPDDVKYIILSHFHADHIGGCRDFPQATFICSRRDYEYLAPKSGMSALKEAFIPKLLPINFINRVQFVEEKPLVQPAHVGDIFTAGYDVFGDGSVTAIFLPGHTHFQFGIVVQTEQKPYFLVADACWTHEAYEHLALPLPVAKLIKSNYEAYVSTVRQLHHLHLANPEVEIVPCHAEVRRNDNN